MAGRMCICLAHMALWKELVWHQRRQCTLALFHCINPSTAALHATTVSRRVSNSSLPERYIPKKLESEEVAGRGVGGGFHETQRSQPYDSKSRAERSLRTKGETNVESASESRSIPSTNLDGKRGSKLVGGGENVLRKGFEPGKQRKKKLQQLPADEKFHFESLAASDAVPDTDKGMESHNMILAAKEYCISLLALAPQPEAKLRMKMSKKNISSEVMDAVMVYLQRCGLQSDQEYAEVFARSRWNGNAWGPKRIKFELLRRGLSEENVEAGLNHVFRGNESADEVDEEEDVAGRWGINQKAAEQLISQARQRWSQGSEVDTYTRKRRMAGWLQRRGFSWDITSDVLRILEREELGELD